MPKSLCHHRLAKELKDFARDAHPGVFAAPNPDNILEWHYVFVITNDPSSLFYGGVYYGQLRFTDEYPNKPPSVRMVTPSGRFEPSKDICMLLTNFHPESWNPSWKAASILTGLLSFMHDTAVSTGSLSPDPATCRRLAAESLDWNVARCPRFRELFQERIPGWRDECAKCASGPSTSGAGEQSTPAPAATPAKVPEERHGARLATWAMHGSAQRALAAVAAAVVAMGAAWLWRWRWAE